MEMGIFEAAGHAFTLIADPYRLMLLSIGVLMGLIVGILPGIGTTAGVAIVMPFTFGLDPYAAFAILVGLAAVGATGDPIPAIMFGVPGGAGSAATVLDGQPMAQRGEAGRALSAAYTASLLGGLCGAVLLFLSVPVLRAFILSIGAPQLLAFAAFGISMVAILSGNAPLRGLTAGAFGIMLSLVGANPQTGTLRWTFDSIYLWDGVPLVGAVLGIYALPELCDLAIRRTSVALDTRYNVRAGMLAGVRDVIRNWWLVIRCATMGATMGTIPGVTGAVIDWLMYGYALNAEKGARETFGKGDVRGVIAVECSNNAKEAGQLVPGIAFGVPTTTSMALIIGAFLSQGLVPGPDMLTKHLDVTYAMVWSMALANIVGAGTCFLFSGYLAKLAVLRYTIILPGIISIVLIGAFESTRQWGDLYMLLGFGVLGWIMKQLKWPRPPLILGLVLGTMIERYLFVAVMRYGYTWLLDPIVIVLFSISLAMLLAPIWRSVRSGHGLANMLGRIGKPTFRVTDLLYLAFIGAFAYMVFEATSFDRFARIVPLSVGYVGLFVAVLGLISTMFARPLTNVLMGDGSNMKEQKSEGFHMDLSSDTEHLGTSVIIQRGTIFFGWMIAFMVLMAAIGFLPAIFLYIIAYMRVENREPWKLVLPQAVVLTVAIHVIFGELLGVHWPDTLLGWLVPAAQVIPSV